MFGFTSSFAVTYGFESCDTQTMGFLLEQSADGIHAKDSPDSGSEKGPSYLVRNAKIVLTEQNTCEKRN